MRYLLMICTPESADAAMSEAEMGEVIAGYNGFTEELRGAKAYVDSARLKPVASATSVRVRDGKTLTVDGPFAETKEQMGGYYLIEADTLDDAVAWATKIPCAVRGTIEVRPVWEMEPA